MSKMAGEIHKIANIIIPAYIKIKLSSVCDGDPENDLFTIIKQWVI